MKKMSHVEIRRKIRWLNRQDLADLSVRQLQQIFAQLMEGQSVLVENCWSTEMFYRVRKGLERDPEDIAELGAPPPSVVTGFQRCNEPGRPKLYLASNRMAALRESRVEVGDVVYLAQWIAREPFPLCVLLTMSDETLEDTFSPAEATISAYFDTIFTRRVHADFSEEYKLTAAVSEVLTNRYEPSGERGIGQDGKIGIRYPSAFDPSNSYNTALDPGFAASRLDPTHVMKLEITADLKNRFGVRVLDTAHRIVDGKVTWNGEAISIPSPRLDKRKALFVKGAEVLELHVRKDPHTEQELLQLLYE